MTTLVGGCHCGAIQVSFETNLGLSELGVRACRCSFCARHGARTTSDSDGRAVFTIRRPICLVRYMFGIRTAEFLLCNRCGVYVGAVLAPLEDSYATINVNALENHAAFLQKTEPVNYDGEDTAHRIARRRARWTPAKVVFGDGNF